MAAVQRSGTRLTDRLATRMTGRVGSAASVRRSVFPDHWSLLLGQVAVASFVVCTLTGVFLLFFYSPSTAAVIYHGPYAPLHGTRMSEALRSTIDLSWQVRGGLLMRQLHNWSGSLMIAALMLHLLRIFFTAGFRRPRTLGWFVLFGVLSASMFAGLTGHILPDDLLAGSSLAVLNGLLLSVPFVGVRLSSLVFGGGFPQGAIATMYPVHVLVLPAVILALLLVYRRLAAAVGPARFPAPARPRSTVAGPGTAPSVAKAAGLFALVAGVLTLTATLVTVNPVWLNGPADPGNASAGEGAPWYLAFLDGAQRLVPPGWEFVLAGRTYTPAIVVPLAVCGMFLLAAVGYPLFERWVAADRAEHQLLQRPRMAPTRTGIGAAGIAFYGILWAAAGADVIALHFSLSVEALLHVLQVGIVVGPAVAFVVTQRVCIGLQRKDRDIVLYGYETGRIVRLPGGHYVEVHQPVDAYESRRLSDHDGQRAVRLRPDRRGRIRPSAHVRASIGRWLFEESIEPVTARRLERRE